MKPSTDRSTSEIRAPHHWSYLDGRLEGDAVDPLAARVKQLHGRLPARPSHPCHGEVVGVIRSWAPGQRHDAVARSRIGRGRRGLLVLVLVLVLVLQQRLAMLEPPCSHHRA